MWRYCEPQLPQQLSPLHLQLLCATANLCDYLIMSAYHSTRETLPASAKRTRRVQGKHKGGQRAFQTSRAPPGPGRQTVCVQLH